MSIIASLAVLSLAASSASAISLTPSCISTLTTTLTSKPASECFATDSLLKFLPLAISGANNSLVPQVDNYLAAWCPAELCSNETVKSTIESVVGGCGEVVSSFGIKNETIEMYIPFIPKFKQIACLETSNVTEKYNYTVTMPAGGMMPNATAGNSSAMGNSSAYCLSSTLAAIEKISGKSLSFSVISSLLNKQSTLASFINGTSLANSSELLCTDCTKGMFASIQSLDNTTAFRNATNSTGSLVMELKSFVGKLCGESFLNGTLPATIKNGSNTNETTTKAGATKGAAFASVSLNTGAVALSFAAAVGAMLL